jgi:hypothetical protein
MLVSCVVKIKKYLLLFACALKCFEWLPKREDHEETGRHYCWSSSLAVVGAHAPLRLELRC